MTRQPPSERLKALVAAAIGLVAISVALLAGPWQLAVLIGWTTAAAAVLATIWREISGLDAAATQSVATREDGSRASTRAMLVGASVISLAAVVVGLHRASRSDRPLEVALTIGALLTVVLSWLLVHTLFTLRYAHLYYADPEGGIDFPGGERPAYADFAYVAFTIGMTFQVSDTDLTAASMRRTVTRHALLSYVFGTAIIASSISVMAGLVV